MSHMKISLPGLLGRALRDIETYENAVKKAREAFGADDDVLALLPSTTDWPPDVMTAGHHRLEIEDHFLRHLKLLRNQTMAGDLTVLDTFFEIYVFDDGVKYKRPE